MRASDYEQVLQDAGDDDHREPLPRSSGGELRDVPMQTSAEFLDTVIAVP
jgi:hypothetical protein